jgi:hypothetical protein
MQSQPKSHPIAPDQYSSKNNHVTGHVTGKAYI